MELLTALQLPHWLMMAGALLVVVGFIGFAFRKNREAATGKEQQAAHLDKSGQAREGNKQVGGDQVESKEDESASELRSYLAAMEDQVLASGNPAAENIVHATRRARERQVSEREVPFRKLLDEEIDRVKAK